MPRGVKQAIQERVAYYTLRNSDIHACFEWLGAVNRGRPVVSRSRGRMEFVSRVILEERLARKLTADEKAMHICNNPACVNPLHIVEGTQADNLRHMQQENRALRHFATLEQLADLVAGNVTATAYAHQVGISVSAACKLKARRLE